MTNWDEAFRDHEIHASLVRLQKALAKLEGTSLDSANDLERFVAASDYVSRTLDMVDPLIVPVGHLDNVNIVLAASASDIEAYLKDKESERWASATGRIEPLLQAAAVLPVVATVSDVKGLRESAIRYRRSAGQLVAKLRKKASEVEKTVDELAVAAAEHVQSIKNQSDLIGEKLNTIQAKYEAAEAGRDTSFTSGLNQAQTALGEAIQQAKVALKDTNAEISDELATRLDDADKKFESLTKASETKLGKVLRDATKRSTELTEELERLKNSAKESVGIIASTGMAGGYEMTANEEKEAADQWRIIATGAFVGMVAIALALAFWPLVAPEVLSWQGFGAKAFASLAFGFLAAYAGREAEKHRLSEREHRRRSLELRSLNPYLEPLDGVQQSAIRAVVADRIFGRDPGKSDMAESGPGIPSFVDVLRVLTGKE